VPCAISAKRLISLSVIVPALVLSACSSSEPDPAEILVKAEAAAVRAETAQKAAEEAAEVARGKYRQIAQAEANATQESAEVPQTNYQETQPAPKTSDAQQNESGATSQE
jgi:PBP1b-binding outer membrane lipoprotein LpoB